MCLSWGTSRGGFLVAAPTFAKHPSAYFLILCWHITHLIYTLKFRRVAKGTPTHHTTGGAMPGNDDPRRKQGFARFLKAPANRCVCSTSPLRPSFPNLSINLFHSTPNSHPYLLDAKTSCTCLLCVFELMERPCTLERILNKEKLDKDEVDGYII